MPPDPQSRNGQTAPWLISALAELGQRELAGAADNPRIVNFYSQVGHDEVRHDEVAWCAAFAGAMLEAAGYRSTRSLMARSYLNWGQPLAQGRPGAIAVFRRNGDPGSGHVAFWLAETGDRIQVLGGNQGDAVSITTMAKEDLLGLRWPARQKPDGANPEPDADLFALSLPHVLAMEGGWTDDPHDPGGPTNFGITLTAFAAHTRTDVTAQTYPELKAGLRAIAPERVRAIYLERYWRPSRAELLPPPIAVMHFDAAVNHGVCGAARLLQQALGVEADGEIGPLTLAAAAAQPLGDSLERYASQRRARYRSLGHFWRFGRGWLARVDATLAAAQAPPFLPTAPHPHPPKGVTPMTEGTAQPPLTQIRTVKWWGHSITIWGTLITALTTVLPLLGPALGVDVRPELVRQLSENLVAVAQAVSGLAGTLMALYGRVAATTQLERRNITLQI
jgi:uncharacterized protein (TIGR02594 family)